MIKPIYYLKISGHFFYFVVQRFFQQRCNETAASLSYTSLLSLVPMLAVIFAAFSSFPMFQDVFEQLQHFVFKNLVPSSGDVIEQYLNLFVEKASKLTFIGMISLFVIALMLMWQVDKSLNTIWQTKKSNNFLRTFLTYWAVLTLGPILMGLSLMLTSYITSLPLINSAADTVGLKSEFLLLIPIIMTMTSFTLVYLIVPNTKVPFLHAIVGGLTATILFELSKKGFAFYISNNKTYSNLYGALATIPIFLVWIYISWLVTLLGAMTTRAMSLFDFTYLDQGKNNSLFLSAFHILRLLSKASQTGVTLSEDKLYKESFLCHEHRLDKIIYNLENFGWIHKTENDEWILAKDLDKVTIWNLYSELPYNLPKSVINEPISAIIIQTNKTLSQELNIPLKEVFVQYESPQRNESPQRT